MRLLLFNPETEYALASGASFYTPPGRVEAMRKERQLLPEAWAEEGDVILVDDSQGLQSRCRLVGWSDLRAIFEEVTDLTVDPWGWNPALVRRMLDAGVPSVKLPDEKRMHRIRELAHRRTTVELNTLWNDSVDSEYALEVPEELKSIEMCMEFYRKNPGCWMKAPWSSSGRGVINTSADMSDIPVEQWCRGILRRQGSVMGETGADRVADFATEWHVASGKAEYLGLSSFATSNRGKYIANHRIGQEEMAMRFNSLSSLAIEDVVAKQKEILENVMTGYDGPCGVDMIVERDGHLRPFVEVNLRRTMGMLFLNS